MRPAAALVVLALVGTALRFGVARATPAPLAEPLPASPTVEATASAEPVAAPAPPDPGPAPPTPIRELTTALPADVKIEVHPVDGRDAGFRVQVRREGHLVALRRLDARDAGNGVASLPVLGRELTDAALVWETTKIDGGDAMETTRGVIRLDTDGAPRARLAEAPAATPEEARRLHRCWSHGDGSGGATVLCRVASFVTAANLLGERHRDVAFAATTSGRSLVRLDLPARPEGVEARVIGYVDARTGVVIRAESSLLPGEARPSLTVLSAEREQRLPVPVMMATPHGRRPMVDIDF